MERSMIWIGGEAKGWACSNCQWKFPVPTLLSGEDAKGAYDRLAAGKFRDHKCASSESAPSFFDTEHQPAPDPGTTFAERARILIKRGYTPKVAADLVLHEMEFEQGNNPKTIEKARAEAENFLQRVRKGLI